MFRPLLADPKQPQFFVNINSLKASGSRYTVASVGFGETFGMYRFLGSREGDGLQLSVEGAIFARFNMEASSHDLINADYTIGIPATYRYGDNLVRFRIYHQSSHLGDEFLLQVLILRTGLTSATKLLNSSIHGNGKAGECTAEVST